MNRHARYLMTLMLLLGGPTASADDPPPPYTFTWSTVVNNGDYIPTVLCDPSNVTADCVHFNSYNQPSVNENRMVVLRARSRGGAVGPVHGIFTRDMAVAGPITQIFVRGETMVPKPNNLDMPFGEPPSFPRIDISSNTVATRGNHEPVWRYLLGDGTETRVGTNGIYTNPYGPLITGASKLGNVPGFSFFQVPDHPGIPFDVFPGAPAVTDGHFIVFKGNYTLDAGKTGVYYRDLRNAPITTSTGTLAPAGGMQPVVLIANNTDTLIPGTDTVFGSTSPPSAANHMAVFSGFDNEENPTLGGIYLAPLSGTQPTLTPLVTINGQVPGERKGITFNKLGEGLSFDGRFVAFWGAWGSETKTLILQCPHEGNKDRVAYCHQLYPDGHPVQIPIHQGIFVYDIRTHQDNAVAKSPDDFDDFLYWNYSGHVPGSTEEGDGEPARWRSSAFAAVSGMVDGSLNDAVFHVAFKARKGSITVTGTYDNPIDGIYLDKGPGSPTITTLIATGMDGTVIDPEAVDDTGAALPVTEMGIERDGFRGNVIVVNVSMGSEETGWAGIYMTEVPAEEDAAKH